ncbi:hypothetical protein JCM5350_001431 [Sporobolomyces pararoseus]
MILTSSSRRLIKLPIEIKHCIISHLPRTRIISPTLPRFNSSSSSSSNSLSPHLTISTHSGATSNYDLSEEQQSVVVESIFESPSSPEYISIPPSTLDHHPTTTSRSPTESLLNLLSSKQFKTAKTLLQELKEQGISIEKDYRFAILGVEQIIREEGIIGDDWLKWLDLVPEPFELVIMKQAAGAGGRRQETNVESRKLDSNFLNLVSKVSKKFVKNLRETLLITEEKEGLTEEIEEEGKRIEIIVQQMKEFGKVLSRKGQSRVVAEELITEIALQGKDVEGALELWEHSLDQVIRQTNSLKETESEQEEGKSSDQRRMERWLKGKNQQSFKPLIRARERIVQALTNLGRVEESIPILLSSTRYPSLSDYQALKLSKNLYLKILSQLASQDRFDLFQQVYEQFTTELGNKLVRIENENLRIRSPYLARKSDYEGGGGESPSAQEAFTTFRDQHAVSSIEEGPVQEEITLLSNTTSSKEAEKEEEVERFEEFASVVGQDFEHYGRTTSQSQSLKLVTLVESSRLDLALDLLTSLLIRGPLPSAQSVSTLIDSISLHSNGQEILEMIEEQVQDSYWRRSFWATCRMLNDLQRGELRLVVRRFRDYFNLIGLPPSSIAAIKGVTLTTPSTRINRTSDSSSSSMKRRIETSTSNSYTLSILYQALVPLLSNSHPTSGGTKHLKNIFLSLFNPNGFDIIPCYKNKSNHVFPLHPIPSSTTSSEEKVSPLDPYSFIPFLLLTLERRFPLSPSPNNHHHHNNFTQTRERKPQEQVVEELLEILMGMHKIGVMPQLPHVALLLSSLASNVAKTTGGRGTGLREFKYLLNVLQRGGKSSLHDEEITGLSTNLVRFVEIQFPNTLVKVGDRKEEEFGEFSPKLYTTLLKSLRLAPRSTRYDQELNQRNKRLVKKEAVKILTNLMEKIGVEGLREMLNSKDGEGLRIEVARLGVVSED